ncbi:hypothetical protein BX616_008890 [Lobosporangium transversale]|uniref:Uncharacterized protein n=1 Tax=Lobosporangium transversale TaxID=64571 RepID=A0A1Y2GUD3_9FUNG|nr:hypothetical protein BCR41DRAFT_349252 [Lobosporangium transversale]KAF9914138.1 hypothetical protein BX616_008890 [Lobosporangium transversale]ORZ23828.1 hypothetical protein BCR41DRAFT_349252 [Lobosporangium transversale]|eukprot:XP_021883642.1 hypothetical protein BCR41DRAFT_349252 [Lobosporangium transversale]
MEYATSLPHFRESFTSFESPSDYTYSNTCIAPLSASSLQAYNSMNSSMMTKKRKAHDFDFPLQNKDESHAPKRLMFNQSHNHGVIAFPSTRQRQESNCSVASTSSWSSSASFSTVCSSATIPTTAALPDLSSSPTNRSMSSRSPSPSSELGSDSEEFNPLWHLCDAIALSERQRTSVNGTAKQLTLPNTMHNQVNDSMYGLKIVFLEPNWLAEHIAKSKKVAALKKQRRQ